MLEQDQGQDPTLIRRNGWSYWLFPDGRELPLIAGGDGTDDADDDADGDDADADGDDDADGDGADDADGDDDDDESPPWEDGKPFDAKRAKDTLTKMREKEKEAAKAARQAERQKRKDARRIKELEEQVKGTKPKPKSKPKGDDDDDDDDQSAALAEERRLREAAEQRAEKVAVDNAIERQAAKLGMLDTEDAALIDRDLLEIREGVPTRESVKDALEDLKDRKPHLFKAKGPGGSADQGKRGKPAPDVDQKIRKAEEDGDTKTSIAAKMQKAAAEAAGT